MMHHQKYKNFGLARKCFSVPCLLAQVTALLILLTMTCPARASVADICDIAAQRAADETGVPVSVLRAITRTETGRKRVGRL